MRQDVAVGEAAAAGTLVAIGVDEAAAAPAKKRTAAQLKADAAKAATADAAPKKKTRR